MNLNTAFAKASFTASVRLRTYRQIAVMLKNGLGIDQILAELYERASDNGKKPNEATAIVFQEWRSSIQAGSRFADAVEGWIPDNERMILLGGERGGDLPDALRSVVRIVSATRKIRSAVLSKMLYPTALLAGVVAYLYFLGVEVIPIFARVIEPEKWASLPRSLHIMSEYVLQHGTVTLVAIMAAAALTAYSLPRLRGPVRLYLERIPPWSIYRLLTGSSFLLSLAAMLGASGRIKEALQTMLNSAPPYLAERLDAYLFGLNSGLDAGEAMVQAGYNFPSKELVGDISVYARHSGDFAAALRTVADDWIEEGVDSVLEMVSFSASVLYFITGFLVIWLVLGFFGLQHELQALTRSVGG